jgi:hypothetical protein
MTDSGDENPPVFRSWRGWYIFVLSVLALLILFFYILTSIYHEPA